MVIAVHGAGGHGKDIAADLGPEFAGYRDDHKDTYHPPRPWARWLVGVNNPRTRQEIAEREGYRGGRWVHSAANIGPDVALGEHTHVNAGAFLTRCTLGEFCTVGPNATVCGDVTIGDRVSIGAWAVIRNLLTICDDVTIGCGAVVVKDITEPGTYVGNPAKPLRSEADTIGGVMPHWWSVNRPRR